MATVSAVSDDVSLAPPAQRRTVLGRVDERGQADDGELVDEAGQAVGDDLAGGVGRDRGGGDEATAEDDDAAAATGEGGLGVDDARLDVLVERLDDAGLVEVRGRALEQDVRAALGEKDVVALAELVGRLDGRGTGAGGRGLGQDGGPLILRAAGSARSCRQ